MLQYIYEKNQAFITNFTNFSCNSSSRRSYLLLGQIRIKLLEQIGKHR